MRRLLASHLPATFAELTVPFQCVAASIERASCALVQRGQLADAVMASCAVPGLLPPVVLDGEHFLDGGLVHSIPIGRALALGATEIYVLHVGRIEQPLAAPRSLWDVCLISFEVARRHRFVEEMANLPPQVRVHVLPSGEEKMPLVSMRYRHAKAVAGRIQRGYEAAVEYFPARQIPHETTAGDSPPGLAGSALDPARARPRLLLVLTAAVGTLIARSAADGGCRG